MEIEVVTKSKIMKSETLTGKEIFCSIGDRLRDDKPLLLSQRQYLINVADNIKHGVPENAAIKKAQLTPMPRGKKSEAYQDAIRKRDLKLTAAAMLLNGSNWSRCNQLGLIIKEMTRCYKYQDKLKPVNEVEKILTDLFNRGLKLPSSTNAIYQLIYGGNL